MLFLKRIRGFSLVEILVVLMLAALLYEGILYSFNPILRKMSDENILETLLAALQFARQEAMMRHVGVALDVERGGAISVFIDPGEAEETQVLQVFQLSSVPKEGHLQWRAFPQHIPHLIFLPSGTTKEQNGTFWYCAENKALPAWAVMISKTGRWRVIYPDEKGRIMDERGKLLACSVAD